MCCDVGLVPELRLTAGCVLMDLASPAVSGMSVYANGLTYALDGHLLRVTIPDAVLIQSDILRMSKILLETCRGL